MEELAEAMNNIPEDIKLELCAEDLINNEVFPTWLWDISSN